jgi:hypothetical protein
MSVGDNRSSSSRSSSMSVVGLSSRDLSIKLTTQ